MTDSEKLDEILSMLQRIVPFVDAMAAMAGPLMGGGGMKGAALRGAMPSDAKTALAVLKAQQSA